MQSRFVNNNNNWELSLVQSILIRVYFAEYIKFDNKNSVWVKVTSKLEGGLKISVLLLLC